MDQWVLDATRRALDRLGEHADNVDLQNTDEFTFRAFFLAAVRELDPTCSLETEWQRHDLLARVDGRNSIIEFKYYLHRRSKKLSGLPAGWKGGAGAQNEREFWECVEKLRRCERSPIHQRIIVLVYERSIGPSRRKSFDSSYGSLAADHRVEVVESVDARSPLVCRVLKVRSVSGVGPTQDHP